MYSLITTFFSAYLVKRNLEMTETISSVAERIEESLDVIDECYARTDRKMKIEVLSDEPVVRELVLDIAHVRDSLLLIANKVYEPMKEETE